VVSNQSWIQSGTQSLVLGVTVALSVDSVKARSLLMLWSLLRRPLNQSVLIQLWFEKWFLNLGILRVDCHSAVDG